MVIKPPRANALMDLLGPNSRRRRGADSGTDDGGPAPGGGNAEVERALEALIASAERACDALGWLGWEARHSAERELRAALDEVARLRRRLSG